MALSFGCAIVYCLKSANNSADVRLGFDLAAIFNIRSRVQVHRVGEAHNDPLPAALLQLQAENNPRRLRQESAGRARGVDLRQSRTTPSSYPCPAAVVPGAPLALLRR